MRAYKGYLIDLDGTVYRGAERIEGAVSFINKLRERSIPYLFVTNNSTKSPKQVAAHLQQFSIDANEDDVLTSSLAAATVIRKENKGASVYMIGETGLREALIEQGLHLTKQDPDYVVVGLDRQLTYDKLATACLAIRDGALFYSTNADKAIPTERGLLPGNGSVTTLIAEATGAEPLYIGKPAAKMVDEALDRLGLNRNEVLMIGDNYETDILAGINAGVDTLLVHTGVTTKEDLRHVKSKPTYTCDDLRNWTIP